MGNTPVQLRVMTWNLHGCVGLDSRFDVDRTGRIIRGLAPDIAAFQEVDSRRKSLLCPDVGAYLCGLVGEYRHAAWTITDIYGTYGHVVASRFPFDEIQIHDVSVRGCEPRKILEIQVILPVGRLRIIAAHLGFWKREREFQRSVLEEIVLKDPHIPCMVLGDLNVWPFGTGRRNRFGLSGTEAAHGSYPSFLPILSPDRIVCGRGARLLKSRAAHEAAMASDHLPILAGIEIEA
jgi:endonuclease/exonuclease/phosphatase family metal-dependent hydrolase